MLCCTCKCPFQKIQTEEETGILELVISSSNNPNKDQIWQQNISSTDTSALTKVQYCSSKSSNEPLIINTLKQSNLLIKNNISDNIINTITDYAKGKIAECIYCGIQDHVNNDVYVQKKDTNQWVFCSNHFVFPQDDTNMICRTCFNKLIKDNDISSSETSVDDSIIISTSVSAEKWHISQILMEIELIRSLLIPKDIILLLEQFAHGEIIECVYCDKEDHMDTSSINKMENTVEWIFCHQYDCERFDLYDTICGHCHDKYLCHLCSDNLSKDNYECGACRMIVCSRCDESGGHLAKHAESDLDLPRRNYQDYLESMLLMNY